MKTEQLYARGNPICPETNYEKENAADKIKALEARAEQIQGMIDEIVDRVANRLLERAEIAEWAMQEAKPSYTAAEIGADEEGSAESALMAAKEYSDSTYRQAAAYTDREIAGLIDGADDTLDTLGEIAAAVRSNESVVAALHNAIGTKASDVELQAHMSNGTVHITQGERNGWDAAVAKLSGIADGADAVSFRRTLTAGTKIGTITISGETLDLYAPENTDTTYGAATASASGLMAAADKRKLDGMEAGADRTTTTTSLMATVQGVPLDGTVGPVLVEMIDSQKNYFANSIAEINSNLSGLSGFRIAYFGKTFTFDESGESVVTEAGDITEAYVSVSQVMNFDVCTFFGYASKDRKLVLHGYKGIQAFTGEIWLTVFGLVR